MMKIYSTKTAMVSFVFLLITHPLFAQTLKIFNKGEKPNGLIFSIILITSLLSALAVHELGHLITGLSQGFRFELFIIGPLGIKRTDNGIKIFLNKNLAMMGGVAATVPTRQSDKNRKKFAYTVLAGPVASLIYSAVCFLLIPYSNTAFKWFFMIAGACSVGLFFATTLPRKSGIFFTDRARFQRLINKGKEGASEEALLSIIATSMADGSCKNIPVGDAKLLQEDKEGFMRFWGYYYEYQFYKENDQPDHADEAKVNLLLQRSSVSPAIWKALKIDDDSVPA